MEFPPFRSEEWIREFYDKGEAHPKSLKGVELSPQYMLEFESIGLYKPKVDAVKEQLRVALFRQALFKVQNVEVTFMEKCKANRFIKDITYSEKPIWNPLQSSENPLLREEIWTIDRCGTDVNYRVRFLKEGENGFNSEVWPTRPTEMLAMAKYYLFG